LLVKAESVSLTIDGRKIRAAAGERVLWAALDNGVYIPNLCAIRERQEPFAACRLCFVEIEGSEAPLSACTTGVVEGMVVNTRGPAALRLARTAFQLLLASHPVDCATCPKNGSCELQRIAKHLGVRLKTRKFRKILPDLRVDSTSPVFNYDPNKCVLCGRCVWVCTEKLGIGAIGFAYRGFLRVVTTFGDEPIGQSACQGCGDCVRLCPVGALTFKDKNQETYQQEGAI